ncbi:MAG: hypothetical protein UX10_C0002G0009 [Candidatus Magasanikbacteria bacterium GW2011_GWA2_45_39]|uniref:Uncharacterized protein n=1 Tax=Candidatus Magasanikbacteria bacterium GW2011_GWA2_45_39 TaxID=1619041 RepID=A0A0G1QHJ1_9BACT|nr:MAG: hypothetical protein UX10_C0002G0009 [Candidatus Magasanikbacteria bacterium GW2011_GWA2_45_39]HBW74283.1 hypothetical protein [Candidatus Magasanikbacteria bacterium]
MASKGHELKFQPSEISGSYPDKKQESSSKHGMEAMQGGRSSDASRNEEFAAERTRAIELKIKSLEDSSRKKSPEEQSSLDATRLEILSQQLPHARVLQDNLSAMRGLRQEIDGILKSMQGIIAPGEKHPLSFEELLSVWANTPDEKLGETLATKLTKELNELNTQYGQLEAQYAERQKMHLETQNRLAELQDNFEEVDSLKQEIVDDITSRIQIKKKGGSLIAESSSAMFEQIGSYLHEYQNVLSDAQEGYTDELSRLEESIPLLKEEAKSRGAGEWLKQLFKKSSERGYAKDRLADVLAKKRAILKNLERTVLIQRALGFASGHVGFTLAGLSNLGSRMELTGGAGVIAPTPREKAPQTFARMVSVGGPLAAESFEFGPVQLAKAIKQKALERDAKNKKTPTITEAAIPEISSTDIHAEDSIPAIPATELPHTQTANADIGIPAVEDLIPARVRELRNQTADVKANDIREMALKNLNLYVDTPPESAGAGYQEKINNYINLIISPEEARTVAGAFDNLFEEIISDEKITRGVRHILQKRLDFVQQSLLARARKAPDDKKFETVPNQTDNGASGSVEAEVEVPPSTAGPLRVEHITKPIESPLETPPAKETEMNKLEVVVAQITKQIGPSIKSFNKGELTFEKAFKQALSKTDIAIQSLSKDERKQLNKMFVNMIDELKETRAGKGKEMSATTEKLLRDIAKRIDSDWVEPIKPTGRWRKWIAGILSTAAIGGAVSEGVRYADTKETADKKPGEKKEAEGSPTVTEIGGREVVSLDNGVPERGIASEIPTEKHVEVPSARGQVEPTLRTVTPGQRARKPKPDVKTSIQEDTDPEGQEDTDLKGPEDAVDVQSISDISKMGIAEQALLRDAHIAFKKVFGLPRLVRAKGYSDADSAAQEKAIRTFEAAAKKVRDNNKAFSLDRQRAENILAAIKHADQEGL